MAAGARFVWQRPRNLTNNRVTMRPALSALGYAISSFVNGLNVNSDASHSEYLAQWIQWSLIETFPLKECVSWPRKPIHDLTGFRQLIDLEIYSELFYVPCNRNAISYHTVSCQDCVWLYLAITRAFLTRSRSFLFRSVTGTSCHSTRRSHTFLRKTTHRHHRSRRAPSSGRYRIARWANSDLVTMETLTFRLYTRPRMTAEIIGR